MAKETKGSTRYAGRGRNVLQVVVTDDERDRVLAGAKRDGQDDDLSAWMRDAALSCADGRAVTLPAPVIAAVRKRARAIGSDVDSLVLAWVTAKLEELKD